jgi:hypothetical protein
MGTTHIQTMQFQCLQPGRNSGQTWWLNQALIDAVMYQTSFPGYDYQFLIIPPAYIPKKYESSLNIGVLDITPNQQDIFTTDSNRNKTLNSFTLKSECFLWIKF